MIIQQTDAMKKCREAYQQKLLDEGCERMNRTIRILGNRQMGKTTLLGHYIKDAQARGLKVLLVSRTVDMAKSAEINGNFKADLRMDNLIYSTPPLPAYDILAVEEDSESNHLKRCYPYLKKDYLLITTRELTSKNKEAEE